MELWFGGVNTECLIWQVTFKLYSYIANNLILARASCRKKREEGSRVGNLKFHIFKPQFFPKGVEKIICYFIKIYAHLSKEQLCKLWDF